MAEPKQRLTGQHIVDQARTWIGTPYQHQAAIKYVGCDCVGLARGIAKELGLTKFDENDPYCQTFLTYSRTPKPSLMTYNLNSFFTRVKRDEMTTGDIVLFGVKAGHVDIPMHVGIYTGIKDTAVHADMTSGYVIEARYSKAFRVSGVWRYPELDTPQGWY